MEVGNCICQIQRQKRHASVFRRRRPVFPRCCRPGMTSPTTSLSGNVIHVLWKAIDGVLGILREKPRTFQLGNQFLQPAGRVARSFLAAGTRRAQSPRDAQPRTPRPPKCPNEQFLPYRQILAGFAATPQGRVRAPLLSAAPVRFQASACCSTGEINRGRVESALRE